MNFESDKECTADYGVFGDNACSCSSCMVILRQLSQREINERRRHKEKQEREGRVSSDFNHHMIDIYNSRGHP